MAKRHSHYKDANRSNKRGGSGGRRKSTRGKSRPGSKNGGQKSHFSPDTQLEGGDLNNPHLSDLDDGFGRSYITPSTVEDYYFNRSSKEKSMKMGGLRLGLRNNSSNELNGGKACFRKRPMEFIKAKDVYDPSNNLIEQLRKGSKATLAEESVSLNATTVSERKVTEEPSSEKELNEGSEHEGSIVDRNDVSELPDNDLYFVDEKGVAVDIPLSIQAPKVDGKNFVPVPSSYSPSTIEFSDTLTIGKTLLKTVEDRNNEIFVEIPNASREKSNPYHRYISNILENIDPSSEDYSDFETSSSDYREENDESEGEAKEEEEVKVELEVDLEVESEVESEVVQEEHEVEKETPTENGFIAEDASFSENPELTDNMQTLKLEEPEFGFLDEDFVVDVSEISVTNLRLGVSDNSYYVKCFRLFSDDQYRWVGQDIFSDFILEDIGLPEHRLQAYLAFIKNSIIPKKEEPEPSYSDIPMSDSSDEEEIATRTTSKDSVTPDMREGLDDLIAYTEKYAYSRNQEYKTSAIPLTGKGRKKKLLIDDSVFLDTESIATLQDKFKSRIEKKAEKRRNKNDFIDEANKNSDDLFKKYPFGLHVQNMKDEFEMFAKMNKERLLFPPLDPHGNKTVMKFAKHYQTKSFKQGRGSHTYIMAQKTRKTNRTFPNYNLIDQLIRQRPIFMRTDVNRPKDLAVKKELPKGKFHTIEGELVGKDAPEIGQENVGRRILQKLGWIDGEGLGANGNKGINEPLMATIKKSKSGLRHNENH